MKDSGTLPQGFKTLLGVLLLFVSVGLTCLWGMFA